MKNGFTLIELLIYLTIFVILATMITGFAINLIRINAENHIKEEVVSGANLAMRAITSEIKSAISVYTPTSIFGTHPGRLSLETTKNLPIGEQTTYVDFYLDDSNRLYIRREDEMPHMVLSEDLRLINLEFEYIVSVSESVQINLTVGYNTQSPDYQYFYTLTSSATLRKQD